MAQLANVKPPPVDDELGSRFVQIIGLISCRMEVQPIVANPDVLKLYHKQKSELHFQQKSDNEFLIFLLDVAVKVIRFGEL